MSNFTSLRLQEDEGSLSSDEKMDTSDSFRSQDTNSISDLEDHEPLRLQNPDLSLVKKMSALTHESPKISISPPKLPSTLTLTTNHPLMGLSSPDEFPDFIPKKNGRDVEKDSSISSLDSERHDANGLYRPQRNTSKNNLYISDNYVTAEFMLNGSQDLPPDVARVEDERRRILPRLDIINTPTQTVFCQTIKHSTPKVTDAIDITREEFHSEVAEWCESPSHLRTMPNFDLPIEMSSSIRMNNELDSPDVPTSSTGEEEKSAYHAILDPRTGSVALMQTRTRSDTRRKIHLPPQEDTSSLDSISASSMESEDEPPPPEAAPQPESPQQMSDDEDDDTKRSKSTNTISYTSEPIPEYSAAEELTNERSWVSVPRAGVNRTCDMKVIEPYKRVISHGGYSGGGAALIVFSACHLPDNSRPDYTYVMDNLFLYVIWTLERLVTEEYILVYLHGSASRRRLPTFHWLHECYKLIDRRLRKSLKHLYLVHPTFWLKSFVVVTKVFVSSKFFSKLHYVKSLEELMSLVPVEPNAIPDAVKQFDVARRR